MTPEQKAILIIELSTANEDLLERFKAPLYVDGNLEWYEKLQGTVYSNTEEIDQILENVYEPWQKVKRAASMPKYPIVPGTGYQYPTDMLKVANKEFDFSYIDDSILSE